jgi:hypothetical protein
MYEFNSIILNLYGIGITNCPLVFVYANREVNSKKALIILLYKLHYFGAFRLD